MHPWAPEPDGQSKLPKGGDVRCHPLCPTSSSLQGSFCRCSRQGSLRGRQFQSVELRPPVPWRGEWKLKGAESCGDHGTEGWKGTPRVEVEDNLETQSTPPITWVPGVEVRSGLVAGSFIHWAEPSCQSSLKYFRQEALLQQYRIWKKA